MGLLCQQGNMHNFLLLFTMTFKRKVGARAIAARQRSGAQRAAAFLTSARCCCSQSETVQHKSTCARHWTRRTVIFSPSEREDLEFPHFEQKEITVKPLTETSPHESAKVDLTKLKAQDKGGMEQRVCWLLACEPNKNRGTFSFTSPPHEAHASIVVKASSPLPQDLLQLSSCNTLPRHCRSAQLLQMSQGWLHWKRSWER